MASVPPSVPPNVTKTDSGEPVTFTITETGKLPITNYVYNSDSFYYIYRSSLPLSETIMNEYLTKKRDIFTETLIKIFQSWIDKQKRIHTTIKDPFKIYDKHIADILSETLISVTVKTITGTIQAIAVDPSSASVNTGTPYHLSGITSNISDKDDVSKQRIGEVIVDMNKLNAADSNMDKLTEAVAIFTKYIPLREMDKGTLPLGSYIVDRTQYDNVVQVMWTQISALYNNMPNTGNQSGTQLFILIKQLLTMLLDIMNTWNNSRSKSDDTYLTYSRNRNGICPLITGAPWETITKTFMRDNTTYKGLIDKISIERTTVKYSGSRLSQMLSLCSKGFNPFNEERGGYRTRKRRKPRKSKGTKRKPRRRRTRRSRK